MTTVFIPQTGSPLLSLPGEIRNKIIRNVFNYEDPVLLVPHIGSIMYLSSPAMVCATQDIQVFTTCRQLHGECKSIFLTNNAFLLSTQPNTFRDASIMGLLSRWMFDLGPYRDYIRKVIIDLSPLCPGPCHLFRQWIDLKPIIMEIWRYQGILTANGSRQRANIDISFAFSGRPLRGHLHHPPQNTISDSNLNAMITLLTPQRIPEMSAYLQSPHVLRGVRTDVKSPQALFILGTPSHCDSTEMPAVSYELNVNGQLERKHYCVNKGSGIARLLFVASIREKLLSLLMGSNVTRFIYNIENQTMSPRLPEPFSINRRFRELALRKFSRVHAVGRIVSYNAQATFDDLRLMYGCMASRLFIRSERAARHEKYPPTILMRFELSERDNLSNLRIPITNIVMATTKLPFNTEIRVELFHIDLPVSVKVAAKTVTLHRLQQQFLVFLTDILDFYPDQSTQVCPRVTMDGNFAIKEAECEREDGSDFLVKNKSTALDSDEMEEEIDLCMNKLLERDDPVTAAYLPHREVNDDGNHTTYILDSPHDHSLLGVAVWLACCL
jgi:hypothetical protein